MRSFFVICSLALSCGASARLATAEDRAEAIKQALAEPILAPGQTTAELRAFIAPRIRRMPQVQSRQEWEKEATRIRRDMLDEIVFRGPAAAAWRDAKCGVEWLDTIAGGPGYHIRKFRYEVLPGMWVPGLLYQPDKLAGKVPLAIHVNGHAPEGKAVEYKQLRSINLAKRGMLVLNLEWFWMGQLRSSGYSHYRLNELDLCGASGLAPFYLAMSRAIDLGLALENAEPARVADSGLSGGGWQTIVISSLDTRVTLANPMAGYGSFLTNIGFDDLGDSEQAPTDMGIVADYAHLTALRAPRPTLLTYNAADDCCFKSGHTLGPLLEAARPIFALYAADKNLASHVNQVPGTHNFEQENRERLYAFIGDHFYPADTSYPRAEMDSRAEVKSAAELDVPLPAENLDLHGLAQRVLASLPPSSLPGERHAAESWRREEREKLRALTKAPSYAASIAESKAGKSTGETSALEIKHLKLQVSPSWIVPAVELSTTASEPKQTAILVADAGRAELAGRVDALVKDGARVLAVDPLLWGESRAKAQDPEFLFALFVAAVGERPLGIQAAELIAIARAERAKSPSRPVVLEAHGPRASAAALVAAALEPSAIDELRLHQSLASFKQLIEQNKTVETLPELFAFGLLADFDVAKIAALVAPRPVHFVAADERARRELQPLAAWYALLGTKHNPAE